MLSPDTQSVFTITGSQGTDSGCHMQVRLFREYPSSIAGPIIRLENHESSDDEANAGEHRGAPAIDGPIEPASRELMQESALQRAAFNPGKYERIDQLVVKSNLSKVSSSLPLGKILTRS